MTRPRTPAARRLSPAEIDVPAGEVRVIESHHAAGFEMGMGVWPFHKICSVAVGRGRLESDGRATDLRRGDFLLLPAGLRHRFVDEPGDPLTLVILCLDTRYVEKNNNRELPGLWRTALESQASRRALCARTAFHHTALADLIRRAVQEQGAGGQGWKTAVQSAANELILRFARGHAVARESHYHSSLQAVAGAVEYIDSRPYEPLRIDEMATRCQLSPRRFTDVFRQVTGETFNAYLNRKRIGFAIERLRETGHILYACHESGFNDLAYFYRVFKKQTGLTPGEFLHRNADARGGQKNRSKR
ncbi:MAG: helix-turn-helix domain-containing protein [Spartobacteria bacterium]